MVKVTSPLIKAGVDLGSVLESELDINGDMVR